MEKRKTPRIRFKGFSDDWEQRKLGKLVAFSKGAGYSKGDLKENGTPIILYGRLYTKYETVISDVDTFADAKENSVYSKGGEVIVPASGETTEDISIASVVEKSGVLLGGDLNVITPANGIDSAFLAISISNGKPHNDMAKMAQGKSVVHLHNLDLAKIDFPYPSYKEQQKIRKYFSNLDHLITLHQRKLEKLKIIKKSMLENCFPKNGEKVPQIRFSGFTNDWEQRKLGEVVGITSGFMGDSLLSDGKYHLTRIETIADGIVDENRVGYLNEKPDDMYLLKHGDILYSNINSISHMGKVAKYQGNSPLYHGINLLRLQLENNINSDFLLYLLNTEKCRNWAKTRANQAVSQASINQSLLTTQEIAISSFEEQKKIGDYFRNLDHLITLHQSKLEKLQKIKKALLERMFV
ncbi:restriction endonuclease subunit S [Veillonella seminalis]|uniref:Restriction endonuclease subunit S n=1 Tax=Veillonella seminalis TaxID=1502943 RepID=A0A833CAG5_9FIRM|nr:restriction endonuclease subunit S [Veillonella seminalis]KAB1477935.1 restriction endonuclease subunit S [Veillonella seminalis]